MIIRNMNRNGRAVANQFVIEHKEKNVRYLQSYESIVVTFDYAKKCIIMGSDWNYSKTTLKYVCQFLTEELNTSEPIRTADIKKMLKNGSVGDWKIIED